MLYILQVYGRRIQGQLNVGLFLTSPSHSSADLHVAVSVGT
jgi:hypothetical protein